MIRFLSTALALALAAAPAHAARFQFCWVGANGYTMEGQIEFPDALLNTGLISEAEVTDFQIIGFRDGVALGSWSLDQRTAGTSWLLRFDTDSLHFPTGGSRSADSYQEWNANGQVNNCGAVGGFGWNGGNYAQDVCIDNVWIEDSSIDPDTPLFAQPMDVRLICETSLPVSSLERAVDPDRWPRTAAALAFPVALRAAVPDALGATSAEARGGDGIATGLASGLRHPILGWDHAVAMVAAGF